MGELPAMHHMTRHDQKNNNPPESSLAISNGIDGDGDAVPPNASLIGSLLYRRRFFLFRAFVASEVFCLIALVNRAKQKAFFVGITITMYIGWLIVFRRTRIYGKFFTHSLVALNFLFFFTALLAKNCRLEVYYWLILVSKTGSHVLFACFRDERQSRLQF